MEEQSFTKHDEIDVRHRAESKTFLEKDEEVMFSGVVNKINKHKVSQKRILIITNKFLYNVVPNNDLLSSIMHSIAPNSALKRKIPISKIKELTLSTHPLSEQFIIHVEGEYDYRYDGVGKRDKIMDSLLHAYFGQGNSLFSIYLKDSEDLAAFHTTDDDFKAKIIKRPSLGKVIVTPQLLKKGLDYIIEKKDTYMMKGVGDVDLNKIQSEIREKRAETFGSYNGPQLQQSAMTFGTFDREKHISGIEDIPLCESGVIPRGFANKDK